MLSNCADKPKEFLDERAELAWRRTENQPVKRLLDDKYLVFETIGDGRYAK